MRIAILSSLFPPDIGGPATYVPVLARHLAMRGHQVIVLAGCSDTPKRPEHEQAQQYKLLFIRRHAFPLLQSARVIWRALCALRQVDLIYAVGFFNEAAFVARLLSKPFAIKVMGDKAWERALQMGLTKAEIESFQENVRSPAIRLLKFLRSWAYLRAGLVIAPSKFLASLLARWGVPDDRIRIIYNAVELPASAPRSSREEHSKIRVASVGRLVAWKRFDLLLEACAELPAAELTIIGQGPQEAALIKLSQQLGLQNRVRFLGSLPKRETLKEMQNSDLFVLCSEYEGLPHVLLEARCLGVPIIAVNSSGSPEALEGYAGAQLIAPGDKAALVSLLKKFRAPATPLKDGAEFHARFKLENMLLQTEQALKALVATN